MRRGTTPTHTFNCSIDATQFTKLNIAYAQNNSIVLEKGLEDCTINGNSIVVKLTEEESLKFKHGTAVEIQIRAGIGEERIVSPIMSTTVDRLIRDGAL